MTLRKSDQLLDTKLFKAFMAAADAENFTNAAKKVFMTQSGISQHIAKLEEQVGLPLFKRIGKQVMLTDAGRRLQKYIEENVYSMEMFLDSVREEHDHISGLVSYAMPPSCLLSPHFGMLLEKRKRYPDITLEVTLASSPEVAQMVLGDEVDFGFVTKRHDHPNLDFRLFCQEEYVLAGSDPEQLKEIDGDTITDMACISYPGADVYFDKWLNHYFPDRENLDFHALDCPSRINSIDGAITMVEGGLGISVFPSHCIMDSLETGRLHLYQSKAEPLNNDIYIATVSGHAYPRAVRQVMDWFFEMHCPEEEMEPEAA